MPHGVLSYNLPLEKCEHRLRAGIINRNLEEVTSERVWPLKPPPPFGAVFHL